MIRKLSDYITGDVLNMFGEDGPRIVTQLINSIYESEEWPKFSLKLQWLP